MTQDLFREVSTSLTSVTSLSLHSLLNFAVKIKLSVVRCHFFTEFLSVAYFQVIQSPWT